MENKHLPTPTTIQTTKGHEELEASVARQQQQLGNLSLPPRDSNVGPPKVTVSLPKHAASRLLDLVQKRDISLLSLGIISVQFEDDQIIPLEPAPSLDSTSIIIKENPERESTSPLSQPPPPPLALPQQTQATSSTATTATISTSTSIATTTHLTSTSNTIIPSRHPLSKSDCNSNSLATFVDQDGDEDKDESEVANEVENQHSSFNIHPLSQFELEMYDNDNILFSDYI